MAVLEAEEEWSVGVVMAGMRMLGAAMEVVAELIQFIPTTTQMVVELMTIMEERGALPGPGIG